MDKVGGLYLWDRIPVNLLDPGAASQGGCLEGLPMEQVLAVRAGKQMSVTPMARPAAMP